MSGLYAHKLHINCVYFGSGMGLTLIDALDTLAVIGDVQEFKHAVSSCMISLSRGYNRVGTLAMLS